MTCKQRHRPESTEASETTETAESISGEPADESAGASMQTEEPTMETLQEQTEEAESSAIQETEEAESTAIQEADTETESDGGNITLIEPESALDADGNVTLTMFTAENVSPSCNRHDERNRRIRGVYRAGKRPATENEAGYIHLDQSN